MNPGQISGKAAQERKAGCAIAVPGLCITENRPRTTLYAPRRCYGGALVLAPDGLTWEAVWPDMAQAERHAAALNEWAAAKPASGEPEMLCDTFVVPAVWEGESRLVAIVDKLCGPVWP